MPNLYQFGEMMTESILKNWIKPEVMKQLPYRVKSVVYNIKLNQNESPWDLPVDLRRKIAERIVGASWNRYPELIPESLKVILAESLSVEPDQIIVGKGSNEVLQALFTACLREGDTICSLYPTFSVYQLLAEQRNINVLRSLLDESFQCNESDLMEKSKQSRITILCNPNSPTGTLISPDTISKVAKTTPGLLIVDEAYVDFSGATALSLLGIYPNLVVLRTFSKASALAGFRIGYAIMNSRIASEIQKCLLPFNMDIPSLLAAEVLLDHMDIVRTRSKQIVQERDKLIRKLNELSGVKAFPSYSNFFLLQTSMSANETFDGLAKQGILVRNVSSYFRCEKMVRITVGTPKENSALFSAIRQLL